MHDVVYQENMLCLIILGHIYANLLKINPKFSDFMFLQGGGTPHVILQGGGMMWYIKKICCVQSF